MGYILILALWLCWASHLGKELAVIISRLWYSTSMLLQTFLQLNILLFTVPALAGCTGLPALHPALCTATLYSHYQQANLVQKVNNSQTQQNKTPQTTLITNWLSSDEKIGVQVISANIHPKEPLAIPQSTSYLFPKSVRAP